MNKKENMEFVEIDSYKEYLDSAKELSDYIKSLPLSVGQNDKLVSLMHKHNDVARKDAFRQGLEFMLDTANNQDVKEKETVN